MDNNIATPINQEDAIKKRRGISASTLKLIAIITMLIDHIGAAVLERILSSGKIGNISAITAQTEYYMIYEKIYFVDRIMRYIGRVSFPIFCFLLVEGFLHTRNSWKYAARLALFAMISEIPFDLALRGKLIYLDSQNVFFTLLIGLFVLIGFKAIKEKAGDKSIRYVGIVVLAAGMALAEVLNTDYSAFGVLTIAVMYGLRKKPVLSMLGGCVTLTIMSFIESISFIDLLLIRFYNGKRGLNLKYVFYLFYPVHLLLLYLIYYFITI